MKNAEPARDIVRRNNSIRDLAWDRLTRDVGRERGDRMRKIKKGTKSARETGMASRGGGGREAGDEKRDKTSGDIFGKCLETQAASWNSNNDIFVSLLRRLPNVRKWWNPYPTCNFPFFLFYSSRVCSFLRENNAASKRALHLQVYCCTTIDTWLKIKNTVLVKYVKLLLISSYWYYEFLRQYRKLAQTCAKLSNISAM